MFAKGRTIKWSNGINKGGKESKFNSKMSESEMKAKLVELGFLRASATTTTTSKKKKSNGAKELMQLAKKQEEIRQQLMKLRDDVGKNGEKGAIDKILKNMEQKVFFSVMMILHLSQNITESKSFAKW